MTTAKHTRIVQETDFLLSLQRDVVSGRAAPASFQRPYVWKEEHVEALWDSIVTGLPLGAFLLWNPPGGASASRTLGPVALRPAHGAALILDGQNRLATLAWSATDPDQDVPQESSGREVWRNGRRLVADTSAKRIRFVGTDERDPWMIPMHVVGHRLQSHLRDVWDGSEKDVARVKWLEDVEHAIRTARIVVTTIHGDEEIARAAYLRMCSAGVPMTPEQFDEAVKGSMDA
jgi:hypothetical protein